ncbi:C-terminal subunit (TktA2) [Commensalibacter communis]|uniref:C-terminal subunit (TktA2) n=1 Tax=Commensalibacter communis TaxID=2972786 RepID=A0A9W4XI10_9PROT|nr:transketolase C-terminal domain-containing protein [Commensalibacter communis]CAI3922559.1 C-terminal subunit (TktA2) [Commensalibacter communis]CAI3944145.1 C-terminal subunit (TktA2) [Commensalibacter communis]CAI3950367.1 C-terminal subunit (TktA2) [Commensalibacter communis]CAI3952013.1 C-terminal subunit (TktA2) [Commensalibacter communis]
MTSLSQQETFDCRQIFAQTLTELARQDERIVIVCNDSVGSSNLNEFKKEFPDRLVNVGIAEQNMIGVAAGLANSGFIPFVSCAGPFLSGRALEQVKADVAYNMYPIILCAQSPGMSYGELGPTHHSIEDFSWIRALTDITLLSPADPKQTKDAIHWAVQANKPVYMRINRFKIPKTTPETASFEVGKALLLKEGKDVTLITTGILVPRALEAAAILEKDGISARVLNMHTLNPIDKEAIIAAASETRGIVTMEEAITTGGLGAAISEVVVENHPTKMRILGVSHFAPTGSASFLLDHFGLNVENIVKSASELVG